MSDNSRRVSRLLAQARSGDVQARDELFQCCRNYLAVLARTQVESWMKQRVDASDLVQQTMLEAHRSFDQFSGADEQEWLAWLKQILSHNTQDFIRRFRTAKRAAGREVSTGNNSEANLLAGLHESLMTPSQVLMAHEEELELANAIAQLSEDHQEVLHLRSLQRLPFEEVAERMGRSRPAVQMLWMRAVQNLERLMQEARES